MSSSKKIKQNTERGESLPFVTFLVSCQALGFAVKLNDTMKKVYLRHNDLTAKGVEAYLSWDSDLVRKLRFEWIMRGGDCCQLLMFS